MMMMMITQKMATPESRSNCAGIFRYPYTSSGHLSTSERRQVSQQGTNFSRCSSLCVIDCGLNRRDW